MNKTSVKINENMTLDTYEIPIEGFTTMFVKTDNYKWAEVLIKTNLNNPSMSYGTEFNKKQLKKYIDLLTEIHNSLK